MTFLAVCSDNLDLVVWVETLSPVLLVLPAFLLALIHLSLSINRTPYLSSLNLEDSDAVDTMLYI